jgi:capsular polysaccharide transport system permease protein
MGGLGQMLGLGGGGGAASQTFSVIDYMQSHDAVGDLQQKVDLVAIFRRPEVDLISRLWWKDPTNERLLKYYKGKVTLTYRQETGITTLDVHAFRPEDSLLIASTLLGLGEGRVNAYNTRVTADMVRVAQDEVNNAEQRVESSETAVTAFREQYGDVDPQASGTSGMELIAGLNGELSQTQMQLTQMNGYLSAYSPQVTTLKNRIAALQKQIALQSELLTGPQSGTLAPILAKYQDLSMRLRFAQQNYTATQTALETAREDAMKQQLFLVRVVEPNLPESSLFPRRFTIVGTFFAVLLLAYSIGWLMVAGVNEHIT